MKNMLKSIRFAEKDKELLEKIESFRKEERIPSFTEAVRQLCTDALRIKEVMK